MVVVVVVAVGVALVVVVVVVVAVLVGGWWLVVGGWWLVVGVVVIPAIPNNCEILKRVFAKSGVSSSTFVMFVCAHCFKCWQAMFLVLLCFASQGASPIFYIMDPCFSTRKRTTLENMNTSLTPSPSR